MGPSRGRPRLVIGDPTRPNLALAFRKMTRHRSFAPTLLLVVLPSACAAQRPATPMMMAAVGTDDAVVVTAFRALLDEVIGDSADRVCVSIARTASDGALEDADPGATVPHALRGNRSATVLPRSACAADERNFGNPRGLLRLRDVAPVD